MRIIQILLGKANPNKLNGVNSIVHNIATTLTELNYQNEVWGISHDTKIKHEHKYILKVFKKDKLRRLNSKLKDELKKLNKNDVVHLHSVFCPELIFISKILTKNKIKWINTPHGQYVDRNLKNNLTKKLYWHLLEKKYVKNSSITQINTENELTYIKNIKPKSDIIIAPNGFNKQDIIENNNERNSKLVFGFCGRLSIPQKGLDLLFKAFSNYKKEGGKGELSLIGDGNDKVKLIELAESLNIKKYISFLGKKTGKEKYIELCNFSYFIHTSRWEGFPMAAVEATALKLPLIMSHNSNMTHFINEYNCGFVTSNEINNIKDTLFQAEVLYGKNEYTDYSFNSYSLAKEKLNWDSIIKDIYLKKIYI